MKNASLKYIEWPDFGSVRVPPIIREIEFSNRFNKLVEKMGHMNLTHIVIYGDREHFANIAWLTGYDPRFEECLLVLSPDNKPLLLVGNEGIGYINVSPLCRSGYIRTELFQDFSLLDQPRTDSRTLLEIFSGESISAKSVVGCIGWKYFNKSNEFEIERSLFEIPSFIVDTLRKLTGHQNVINITDILMHSEYGLRSFCSVDEIAYFEFTNIRASDGMKRIIFGINPGEYDFEIMKLAEFEGLPLGCHPVCLSKGNIDNGLSSPIGYKLQIGDPFAANVCYWGSNSCRAGWIVHSSEELEDNCKGYVNEFVEPYFIAFNKWLSNIRIGTTGDKLWKIIQTSLPFGKFNIFLNPGHLIHLDEWLSSPIYEGSEIQLHSGMAVQSDIIPSSPRYFSTRVEDGFILADNNLRNQLREEYPECYSRCESRKRFMGDVLGLEVPDEVLVMSNIPGIIPPFLLDPNNVMTLS